MHRTSIAFITLGLREFHSAVQFPVFIELHFDNAGFKHDIMRTWRPTGEDDGTICPSLNLDPARA